MASQEPIHYIKSRIPTTQTQDCIPGLPSNVNKCAESTRHGWLAYGMRRRQTCPEKRVLVCVRKQKQIKLAR